jgi:hypothetical protein
MTPMWTRVLDRLGSILGNGIALVCGMFTVGSWNGPLTRMFAIPTPMNDIISVVMISLVSYHAFSSAGINVHSAPAQPATRKRTA